MKLPKSIRVAAFDIEVQEWDTDYAALRNRFGEFSPSDQAIRVQATLKPQKLLDTTLHEISHAIYWAYGLEDEDKEERIVTTFATAWAQIWRDNPEFHKWVGETAKAANGAV